MPNRKSNGCLLFSGSLDIVSGENECASWTGFILSTHLATSKWTYYSNDCKSSNYEVSYLGKVQICLCAAILSLPIWSIGLRRVHTLMRIRFALRFGIVWCVSNAHRSRSHCTFEIRCLACSGAWLWDCAISLQNPDMIHLRTRIR